MNDASFVDVGEAQCCLEQHAFHLFFPETELLLLIQLKRVFRKILKNDPRFSLRGVLFEIEQPHDAGVIKVFEEVGLFESNLLMSFHKLHGESLPRLRVSHKVNRTEITAAHLLQHLVFVHGRLIYS